MSARGISRLAARPRSRSIDSIAGLTPVTCQTRATRLLTTLTESSHVMILRPVNHGSSNVHSAHSRSLSSWHSGRRYPGCSPPWSKPVHRDDCTWLNSKENPHIASLDKACPACRDVENSDYQLSRKELEWEREQQKARAIALAEQRRSQAERSEARSAFFQMLHDDPFEGLFGQSNRRLRGLSNTFPTSILSQWRSDLRKGLSEQYQRHQESTTTRKSESSDSAERSTDAENPVISASVSWSTSGYKNGQSYSSSGELVYDPISMRMVPRTTKSHSSSLPTGSPYGVKSSDADRPEQSSVKASNPAKASRESASHDHTKRALEKSWDLENDTKSKASRNAQPLETALDRVSGKDAAIKAVETTGGAEQTSPAPVIEWGKSDLMKGTLRTMAKLSPRTPIVRSEPRTSAHSRYEEAKLQALRQMSQEESWTFELLGNKSADELDQVHQAAERKALEILVKQDPVAFKDLPKQVSKTMAQQELVRKQREWEAKADAIDKRPKDLPSGWPAGREAWLKFKNAESPRVLEVRQADHSAPAAFKPIKSIEYSSKEARHACLSVFRREKPLRSMSSYELGLHRSKLLKAWASRQLAQQTPIQTESEKMLGEEIKKYKHAMNAFESKWPRKSGSEEAQVNMAALEPTPIPRPPKRDIAEIAGEGDIDVNIGSVCDASKWYKQKAPHAITAEERQKENDRQLVHEIRRVYESAYGKIDQSHRQPVELEDGLEDYDKRMGEEPYKFKYDGLDENGGVIAKHYSGQTESSSTVTVPVPPKGENSVPAPSQPIKQARTSPEKTSEPKTIEPPKLSVEQQSKNVNKLLDMYRKQADGYVEVIGRLQRKVQGLQREISQAEKKPVAPAPPAAVPKPYSMTRNPIDGTTAKIDVTPPTGNFASPTGFVGEVPPSMPETSGSRPVRREELVFSGQQPLQKASIQEIIDHLQQRINASTSSSPPPPPPNASSPPSGLSGRSRRFRRSARHEQGSSRRPGRYLLRTVTAMIGVGFVCAVGSYAIGVVVEYFRRGPPPPDGPSKNSYAEQSRGWAVEGNRSRRRMELEQRAREREQAFAAAAANRESSDADEALATWQRGVATVAMLPLAGLGVMYAWLLALGGGN